MIRELCLTAFLLIPFTGLAQSQPADAKITQPVRNTILDMDGARIVGSVRVPLGTLTEIREPKAFEKQVPDRLDFQKELRKSLSLD